MLGSRLGRGVRRKKLNHETWFFLLSVRSQPSQSRVWATPVPRHSAWLWYNDALTMQGYLSAVKVMLSQHEP
jgi:hypothetical protein